ncbi:PD-(D/E)XK motif protein [Streptomyces sp. L2]|uniref:PD-(D/E)XK motif protein n=1 Tax=Streptomyces sp. L2 TaxID=2162665 RepID=UPI001011E65B|nr:PD-(D/E)XK motif protein [Streptomyces sp. L2]
MSEDAVRELLEEHWAALEVEQPTGARRMRVAQLPTATAQGRLIAGMDHEGIRHILIPVHSHRKIRTGLDGPVLRLIKRPLEDAETYQTYADLSCLRTDLNDLFTGLCVDVLRAVAALPENPVKALYRVLDRWKALFQSQHTALGPEQIAGLFGELLVLSRLLERDSSAHRLWRGPEGHHHDFLGGADAIEVKTSSVGGSRTARIHGLDQLDAPPGGALFLAWFRLDPSPRSGPGLGFLELIERALRLCDDESALSGMLAATGYLATDADKYQNVRFAIGEERWYRVTSDFPRLTTRALLEAGVPISVQDVEYTIDLPKDPPASLPQDGVVEVLDRMIRESV